MIQKRNEAFQNQRADFYTETENSKEAVKTCKYNKTRIILPQAVWMSEPSEPMNELASDTSLILKYSIN